MKKTKNKIIKGISVLVNGPLYCALFFSVGWKGCNQKTPLPIFDEQRPIDTEPDDPSDNSSGELIDPEPNNVSDACSDQPDDPSNTSNIGHEQGADNLAFEPSPTHSTNDPKDVSGQPDEEAAPVPPLQPSNSSPKVVVGENSNKTNTTNKPLIPGQNNGPNPSNKLGPQNTAPASPKKKEAKCGGQKVTDPKSSEANRDRLDPVKTKDNTEAKPQPSGYKRVNCKQPSSDTTKVGTSLDQTPSLETVKQKLEDLKSLIDQKKEQKQNNTRKIKKINTIKADCEERTARLNQLSGWSEEEKRKALQLMLQLIGFYEKQLKVL